MSYAINWEAENAKKADEIRALRDEITRLRADNEKLRASNRELSGLLAHERAGQNRDRRRKRV